MGDERSLAGVRVLDLSRLLPGPYCTIVLSDLGASIDKVEDPRAGDYLRMFPSGWPPTSARSGRFAALNRDKRSLVLDLKHADGKATLLKILPRYDVLVESFRPGVMERLGLGWDVLSAHHPRLVSCGISGYPARSSYRDRAAHDVNTIALAGVLGLSGPTHGTPPIPPVQLADLTSGLFAATSIAAALFAAQRSGAGRRIDVSMSEAAFGLCMPTLGDLAVTPLPGRGADLLTGGAASYGVYRTRDDKLVSLGALEEKFWAVFCRAIGRECDPSELTAGADVQARVRAELQACFLTKTRDEWSEVFSDIDGCCEPVLAPEELARHALHRDRFVVVDGLQLPLSPVADLDATHTRAPKQGEHSDVILREAGISDDEIARLHASGATR